MIRGVSNRLTRVSGRARTNARRAWAGIRRGGPGRHPGYIDHVESFRTGMRVRGHVVPRDDKLLTVFVRVNAQVVALASPTGRIEGSTPERISWEASVPGELLPPGDLDIDVYWVGSSGLVHHLEPARLPASARSGVGPVEGYIDHPADGAVVRGGVLEVAGWATDVRLVDRVEISIDGVPVGRARINSIQRHDLFTRTGRPTDILCGFEFKLDLDDYDEGSEHCVEALIVGGRTQESLGVRSFTVGPFVQKLSVDDRRWLAPLRARSSLAADTGVAGDGMRLLVLAHDLELGGAQLWLQEILDQMLGEWDVSATVVCPRDGFLRSRLEEAGARVHLCGPLAGTFGRYESLVRELVDLVVDDGSNVVLANTEESFIGVDVATRCRLPSVYTIHEHFPRWVRGQNVFGTYGLDEHVDSQRRLALESASVVGFVSDATRHLYGLERDPRAATLAYGVPLDEVDKQRRAFDRDVLRRDHGYLASDKVLICVATVSPRKAQANLVLAFARIAGLRPDIQLVLVGTGGDVYSSSVVHLAHVLGLGRRVRILPVTDQVAPWFVMADGMVLPSDIESLPRSIIEAMAYEVPVLATDAGGTTELVSDGRTGLLMPSNDVGALVAGLLRWADSDPAELRAMTQRALNEIQLNRDGHRYVDYYSRILRGLVKGLEGPAALADVD